ncbi:response regulator [Aquiflexum gelatinilyticum]|uniref:Response regulator transcription factor n=1 Tax=Aquiflexum gelatinilyticum TaxID=2961943 RepID=A0A9X2T2K7_9BACT|nr:response regulator transcription factor [Aquiflexum gelatinilyticum]MCR9015545.1 response regulator transcription factor [Aquiflexum gelatinilyticum]MCS4433038.1 response regulator transcription factor [Aquiflexum gelatinilyticum]
MPTKILIYDDNTDLREGICHLLRLREEYEVVGEFGDAKNVLKEVGFLKPDVILMDIEMPGITGVEAVKKIRTIDRNAQIIMLTVFDDQGHIFEALQSGANGYLLKRNASDRLVQSIEEVLSGGAPMSPSIARLIISEMQLRKPQENYQLSIREKEILKSLATGNSFKLIASDLQISLETVRTHIKKIYEKLQVHSQIEAVSKALNEKLV